MLRYDLGELVKPIKFLVVCTVKEFAPFFKEVSVLDIHQNVNSSYLWNYG